jgi:hypothetical protein
MNTLPGMIQAALKKEGRICLVGEMWGGIEDGGRGESVYRKAPPLKTLSRGGIRSEKTARISADERRPLASRGVHQNLIALVGAEFLDEDGAGVLLRLSRGMADCANRFQTCLAAFHGGGQVFDSVLPILATGDTQDDGGLA